MATATLRRRLDNLEAQLGTGAQVAVGMICPDCGAPRPWNDNGTCPAHDPMPEADMILLVTFVAPS